MLAKTDTRVFNVNDFIGWDESGELNLNPSYQRDAGIWDEKTKSFLIDTIVRGLPIPPIYVRLSINVKARKITREIIDGKQRLTTILSFYNNEFPILEAHNTQLGGKKYEELDEETKIAFLNKDLSVVLVFIDNEAELRDIFARLNSSNAVLNAQELRNAKYQNDFKIVCYELAKQYKSYFLENKILKPEEMNRMEDAEIISKIMFLLIEGEKNLTPETLDKLYESFENNARQEVNLAEKAELLKEILALTKKHTGLFNFQKMESLTGLTGPFLFDLYLYYKSYNKSKEFKEEYFNKLANQFSNGDRSFTRAIDKLEKNMIFSQVRNQTMNYFNPLFLSKVIKIGQNTEKTLNNLNKLRKDKINDIFDLLDQLAQ